MDLGEYGGETGESKDLSWRDDPSASLSDYIIKVVTDKDDEVEDAATYNVHRCQLAMGPRSCDYFRRLFINRENAVFSDCKQGMSEVRLPASAADAFASFLDFVYGVQLALTTNLAIPLLHLANYFGNRAMYEAVVEFIQKDLVGATSPFYMVEAEIYKLDKVATAASKLCVADFAKIDAGKLAGLTPTLFMRVVQSPQLTCTSLSLSQRVAAFCHAQPTEINQEFLEAVASASIMPIVDETVAPILLQQALAHSASAVDDDSLRKRCVRALAPNWKALLQPNETCAPAAKRQRTSEVGFSVQMTDVELPIEVKLELAMTALFDGEKALATANLRAEENAKRAEEEKRRADGEKTRADKETKIADVLRSNLVASPLGRQQVARLSLAGLHR